VGIGRRIIKKNIIMKGEWERTERIKEEGRGKNREEKKGVTRARIKGNKMETMEAERITGGRREKNSRSRNRCGSRTPSQRNYKGTARPTWKKRTIPETC